MKKRAFVIVGTIVILIATLVIVGILLSSISENVPKVQKTTETTLNNTKQEIKKISDKDFIDAKRKCSLINKKRVIENYLSTHQDIIFPECDNILRINEIFFRDCNINVKENTGEYVISCDTILLSVQCNQEILPKCLENVEINCIDNTVKIENMKNIESIYSCR